MVSTVSGTAGWDAVDVLAEPTRRRVFEAVRRAHAPCTRDDVAAAAGISRRLAAFHLDLLADADLLTVDFARPPGRRGPGAGRPAKRYAVPDGDIAVSVPPRRYDVLARLLAVALIRARTEDPIEAPPRAAYDEGRRIGALRRRPGRMTVTSTIDATADALDDLGFDPDRDENGGLRLRNCPFHAIADVAPDLVCGMNTSFIGGLVDGLGGHRSVRAELEPAPPNCCVVVRRS